MSPVDGSRKESVMGLTLMDENWYRVHNLIFDCLRLGDLAVQSM